MVDFALIGAAGFVASRHLRAIADTGNRLVAALDPNDSVGILDSFFPDAEFFTEFESFERYVDDLKRQGKPISYVSVCSPNYLHDPHVRFGLRQGANVICEKPLVLDPASLNVLSSYERETGARVYTILQLRLHPSVVALREHVKAMLADNPNVQFDVELAYVTGRGRWYHSSWKADLARSGGLPTNIGIHFFDMLIWIFGDVQKSQLDRSGPETASGRLRLQHANVRWLLSIDVNTVPAAARARGQRTYRSLKLSDSEIEFSEGFTELHTASYRHILAGSGFGLADAEPAVRLAHELRSRGE